MRLALFQPDQAGNVGALVRLSSCLAVPLDIVLPCGFALSDRTLKRAAMDYAASADVSLHANWTAFRAARPGRLVLLTTSAPLALPDARFAPGDILLVGSESAGVPADLHDEVELGVRIPQAPGTRSLNIVAAASIALSEALRQTKGWPR